MHFLTLWLGVHLHPKALRVLHSALKQTPVSGWINISCPSSLHHYAHFIQTKTPLSSTVISSVYQKLIATHGQDLPFLQLI